MSLELISIIVLLLMFVIGAFLPINLGILGFVAAFLVGSLVSGMSVDDIFSGFPGDLFVLLAGVTYLFSIVQNNGTVDLITGWGLRLVKGNLGLVPWVMFSLCTLLTGVGTLGPAAIAILAPISMRFAFRYNINPLLMGVMVVIGSTAGSFSPLNPYGVIVNGVMESRNLPFSPGMLFINAFIYGFVVSMLIFIALGGLRMFKRKTSTEVQVAAALDINAENNIEKQENGLTFYKGVTLLGLVALVVLALGFKVNIGFAAFIIGLILALIAPKQQSAVLGKMPWSVILLITGIVTYVEVLEAIGTIEYVTELIANVGNPVIAALSASYVGGFVSAFASTTGMLAALIPLAAPILQDPAISSIGVVSAIAIASSIVDLSPFSTNGALLLANVQGVNERVFFKQLLLVTALVVVFGPGLAWLIFVVIGG
ncbi:SLC13 family permease [Fictibacillus terranigra]|uniref:SLC13 family permease n=1 Tax=Fictibacillus terranigra TaxID=3058424 RepID=A0ABT8EBR1_9BACL|nr:SLC13 family permease [Fictibacillus sp. CENA-BCM004]MDN4075354.1 SLC13 family permease [Fictibacillus sp. CENA-BCM004]